MSTVVSVGFSSIMNQMQLKVKHGISLIFAVSKQVIYESLWSCLMHEYVSGESEGGIKDFTRIWYA